MGYLEDLQRQKVPFFQQQQQQAPPPTNFVEMQSQPQQIFGGEFGARQGGDFAGWNGVQGSDAIGTTGGDSNWFNDGTIGAIGAGLQGVGSIAGIGLGFAQLSDLRKAREQSQANFEKNYAAQRDSVNEDRSRRNFSRAKKSTGPSYQAKMLA